MNLDQLQKALTDLTERMENSVSKVENASIKAQNEIYKAILSAINSFELNDGNYVIGQDYAKRFAVIQKKIEAILGDIYYPSLTPYLNTYSTVEDTSVSLHKSYNELIIDRDKLAPAKRAIYNQAEYYLSNGLADAYVQPAKYLLMQQVSTGISIDESRRVLKNWNDGELTSGKLASGRPTPNLQKYATQIARDSLFQYNGTIQDVIANEYDLEWGIYVGGLLKDSRPFCKHMVGLRRKIKLTEIPDLLKKYPQGIIPGTTMKNFPVYRAGYNCIHTWMPVKA